MVETLFAQWQTAFDIEHNRGRSGRSFKSRLEQFLFVDIWQRIN